MKNINHKILKPLSWIEVDLSCLAANYRLTKRLVGTKVKIMAVVKADAYGHGLIPVARKLRELGADYLAVASIQEAMEVKESGIKSPILVLNATLDSHLDVFFEYDISLSIVSLRQAEIISRKAKALNKSIKVHIEIDTGMGRTGIWHRQAREIVKKIVGLPFLEAEGIFTHFPSADTDFTFTRRQISNFKGLLYSLRKEGIYFKLTHAANSAAIINSFGTDFNMVRPGLMLYGLSLDKAITKRLGLAPVMSFKTRVVFLKNVYRGRPLSYDKTYIAKSRRIIATLAVGYADGYNRFLSNKGEVLIRGKRARIAGRVCMDNIMADVTLIKGVKVGDEAILFGKNRKIGVLAEELANICDTIVYEIVCSVSKDVERFYVDKP